MKSIFTQRESNNHQRRWLEPIKDIDLEFLYHPGKANVVAGTLSGRTPQEEDVARLTIQPQLQWDLIGLELDIRFPDTDGCLSELEVVPDLSGEILQKQEVSPILRRIRDRVSRGEAPQCITGAVGRWRRQGRICVPSDKELRERIFA